MYAENLEISPMPTVNLNEVTFSRLQKRAIPLVDDLDSVITRLLDQTEDKAVVGGFEPRVFSPSAPPNLAFSSIRSAMVDGKPLEKGIKNWNGLMLTVIREAHAKGMNATDINQFMNINSIVGQKEDEGYKYLEDINLSVQGQDANAAYRQAYKLAAHLGFPLEVNFSWSDVEKAANPGMQGSLKS